MNLINDLVYINKTTLLRTIDSFKKNWMLIFTGIVYTVLNLAIFSVIGILFSGFLSILAGIVIAIVTSSFISNYLYLLYNVINFNKISIQDFKDGFKYFLWKIYGVLFIAYIGSYFLSILNNVLGGLSFILNIAIYIGILIFLNPLPETIYLKSYSAWDSVVNTMEFMQENWFNWLVPNVIFYLVLYFLTGNIITDLFATHISFNMMLNVRSILVYIVGQGLFSLIMIYRGHLYKLLSGSSRRKRMFMNKF